MEPRVFIGNAAEMGYGPSGRALLRAGGDLGALRPWVNPADGRSYVTLTKRDREGKVVYKKDKDGSLVLNARQQPTPEYVNLVTNAPATLLLEDWLKIDRAVAWAAKQPLRFWGDIYGANPVNVPNAMGVIAIQHSVADGSAVATISMDGLRKGERSRPLLNTGQIPLPIIHSDGQFTLRDIAVAKGTGMDLDLNGIRLAARAVAETVEGLSLGTIAYAYGGNTIYGLTNHPARTTTTMTLPTAGGWTPATLLNEILAMRQTLYNNLFYGPYALYYSTAWDAYLDKPYSTIYNGGSLRGVIQAVEGVSVMRSLPQLTGYQMILIQMDPNTVEGIQGYPITTTQWQEGGGFEEVFKVWCMQIPRFRADYNSKMAENHGTSA